MRERKEIDAHRRDANRERRLNCDEADEIKIENRNWLQCLTSEQSIRQFIFVSSWKDCVFKFITFYSTTGI